MNIEYDKSLQHYNEKEIRELLLYHKVIKADIDTNTLTLDNGTELTFYGNIGCYGYGIGTYSVTELNECDNIITDVKFVNDDDIKDKELDDMSYKIFVCLIQAGDTDGSGCYGRTVLYTMYVKLKNNNG